MVHSSLPSVSYITVVPDAINVSKELLFTSSLASCASFIIFTIFGENIASVVTNASSNVRSISLLINLRLLFFLIIFLRHNIQSLCISSLIIGYIYIAALRKHFPASFIDIVFTEPDDDSIYAISLELYAVMIIYSSSPVFAITRLPSPT